MFSLRLFFSKRQCLHTKLLVTHSALQTCLMQLLGFQQYQVYVTVEMWMDNTGT